MRVAGAESRQACVQPLLQKRSQCRYAQCPGIAICPGIIQSAFKVLEGALYLRQQLRAFFGQHNATAVAPQECATQIFLQRTNLETYCTGSDTEVLCGAGEIQPLCNSDEYAQAAERQPANRPAWEARETLRSSQWSRSSGL